jgi:hypothetical protein
MKESQTSPPADLILGSTSTTVFRFAPSNGEATSSDRNFQGDSHEVR